MQLAPNPLYVTLVVGVALFVVQSHASDGPLASAFPVILAAGAAFAVLRLVLNALTTHGTGAVLFELPDVTLPTLLGGFMVGGTVETAVIAQAASEGWAIVGIVACFAAFNAVVSHHELVQAAPRAFYELGLSVTIALAFLPSTIEAIAAVREADRARTGGRIVRRGRLLRQIVPVLESGMERAVHLAESMDSRGFGRSRSSASAAAGWLGLASMLLLGSSFVALIAREATLGAGLAAAGAFAVMAAVVVTSRATTRVRYRPRRVAMNEWALAALAWVAPAGLLAAAAAGDGTLRWPGEELALPAVSLLPLFALTALAVLPATTART